MNIIYHATLNLIITNHAVHDHVWFKSIQWWEKDCMLYMHVLNGPAHPTNFDSSQPQLTALLIQFSFSENALKLTYSNVETQNLPSDPRNREGEGREGEERGGREMEGKVEGKLVPPLCKPKLRP